MSPRVDPRKIRRALRHNLLLKVFSLVFALGLWAFVNLGARDAEKTLSVPVELRNVPPEVVVTNALVEAVDVRIRGPRTLLGTIDERRMRIPLNLGKVRPGSTSFKVDPDILTLPRGVRVTRLSPVEIDLDVERLVQRRLPVKVSPETMVPEGYRLEIVEIRPRAVVLQGPESEIRGLKQAVTVPLALRNANTEFEESVAVERPSSLVQVTPDRVGVRGSLEDIIVEREHEDVEIGVRNAQGPVRLSAPRSAVTLKGPQRILDGFRPGPDNLYVDVGGLEKGRHELVVQVQLPEGVRISAAQPRQVTVEVTAAAPAAATPP